MTVPSPILCDPHVEHSCGGCWHPGENAEGGPGKTFITRRQTWAQTVQRQDTASGDFIVITSVFTLPHSGQTSDSGSQRL